MRFVTLGPSRGTGPKQGPASQGRRAERGRNGRTKAGLFVYPGDHGRHRLRADYQVRASKRRVHSGSAPAQGPDSGGSPKLDIPHTNSRPKWLAVRTGYVPTDTVNQVDLPRPPRRLSTPHV